MFQLYIYTLQKAAVIDTMTVENKAVQDLYTVKLSSYYSLNDFFYFFFLSNKLSDDAMEE